MRTIGATQWVVAGHSRGAEIASRMVLESPASLCGLVLIGSSHPRDISLAHVTVPVARVYGTRDTVADVAKVEATRHNLPASARQVRIDGGNHSQFGYYGFQPGDWPATISREAQQAVTLEVLLGLLGSARPD
jgi:pimeloyl-ACP methyl ester carboxylesterase